MRAGFENVQLLQNARALCISFRLVNLSGAVWRSESTHVGWQLFDPDTGTFIREGDWATLPGDLAPAESCPITLDLELPPERGSYHAYLSLVGPSGWSYEQGNDFVLLEASVQAGEASVLQPRVTSLQSLRRQLRWRSTRTALLHPLEAIWRNRQLIQSMVRRDIYGSLPGQFRGRYLDCAEPRCCSWPLTSSCSALYSNRGLVPMGAEPAGPYIFSPRCCRGSPSLRLWAVHRT